MANINMNRMILLFALTLIMVTPVPAIPEKVQKTIEECSSKISVNNGNLLKESFLGRGDPTSEVCRVLVDFGKTCHEAFTKLMISKRPAAEESKIWARSKSIWEHCSHDVPEKVRKTIEECSSKISVSNGNLLKESFIGKGDPTSEVCRVLVDFGKTCHQAFTKLMISKRPACEESKIWARSKSIWKHCSHDVPEKVQKTIEECSSKISVNNGNLLKESFLGKGDPTNKVCRVLVKFGKTCHEAFTKLMVSKRPACEKSKIWARSKSIWEHCSHM